MKMIEKQAGTYREAATNIWNVEKQQSVAVVWSEVKTDPNSDVNIVADELQISIDCWERKRNDVPRLTNTCSLIYQQLKY